MTPARVDYLLAALRTGLVALAGFVAVTLASGLGWGWVRNLSVPLQLRSYVAPPTLVGAVGEAVLRFVGAPESWVTASVPTVQSVAALAALAALVWLTWSVAPRHPVGAAAGAFTAVVLGGPVLQPWYLVPCITLFGVAHSSRRVLQATVWVTVGFVGYSAFDVGMGNGVPLVAVAVLLWAIVRLARSRTDRVDEPLHDLHRPVGVAADSPEGPGRSDDAGDGPGTTPAG